MYQLWLKNKWAVSWIVVVLVGSIATVRLLSRAPMKFTNAVGEEISILPKTISEEIPSGSGFYTDELIESALASSPDISSEEIFSCRSSRLIKEFKERCSRDIQEYKELSEQLGNSGFTPQFMFGLLGVPYERIDKLMRDHTTSLSEIMDALGKDRHFSDRADGFTRNSFKEYEFTLLIKDKQGKRLLKSRESREFGYTCTNRRIADIVSTEVAVPVERILKPDLQTKEFFGDGSGQPLTKEMARIVSAAVCKAKGMNYLLTYPYLPPLAQAMQELRQGKWQDKLDLESAQEEQAAAARENYDAQRLREKEWLEKDDSQESWPSTRLVPMPSTNQLIPYVRYGRADPFPPGGGS